MSVDLYEPMIDESSTGVSGWQEMRPRLDVLVRTERAQRLVDAHAETVHRVAMADYHNHIISQIYTPNQRAAQAQVTLWVEAEFLSAIFTLYSVLDILAQEIWCVYDFRLREEGVKMWHPTQHPAASPRLWCLRCQLRAEDDDLSAYLDTELARDWYPYFHELRNQVTHRRLVQSNINLNLPSGEIMLEIPNNLAGRSFLDSTRPREGKEIKAYLLETRENVVRVLGETYRLLLPKIQRV
jgi:hypothetical protein